MAVTTPTSMAKGEDEQLIEHQYRLDALKLMAQSGISKPSEVDLKAVAAKLRAKDEAEQQRQQMEAMAAAQQPPPPLPNAVAPPPPAQAMLGAPPTMAPAGAAGPSIQQVLASLGGGR